MPHLTLNIQRSEPPTLDKAWDTVLDLSKKQNHNEYPLPAEGEFTVPIGIGDGVDEDFITVEGVMRFAEATGRSWTRLRSEATHYLTAAEHVKNAPGHGRIHYYPDSRGRQTRFAAATPDQLAYTIATGPTYKATPGLIADLLAYERKRKEATSPKVD